MLKLGGDDEDEGAPGRSVDQMQKTREDLISHCETILEDGDYRLPEWLSSMLESIKSKLQLGGSFSEKQEQVVRKTWENYQRDTESSPWGGKGSNPWKRGR